jgi:hypothetical protein
MNRMPGHNSRTGTTAPKSNARGSIDEEGNFSLYTFSGNKKLPGAAPGEYLVTVSLLHPDEHGGHAVTLKTVYKVEAKENVFEIVLERMP